MLLDDVFRMHDDRLDQLEVGGAADVECAVGALYAGEVGVDAGLYLVRREVLEIGELVERVPARLAGVDRAAEQFGQSLDLRDDLVAGLLVPGARVELREHVAAVLELPRDRPWLTLCGERQR